MKVIITKDSWGVNVWKENTNLIYQKPFNKIPANPTQDIHNAPNIDVNSDKVWMVGYQWPFGKLIYKSKYVKKFFPNLASQLKIGEKVEGNMDISVINTIDIDV